MISHRSRWQAVSAVVLVGFGLAGCGSKEQASSTAKGPSNKQMVVDVGEWLKAYAKDYKKAPSKPADLGQYEPTYPDAFQGLTNKIVVSQWGQGLSTGGNAGNTVLAYEKDVETKGGWVLMQDGSVKEMTPEQFKAAPKAGR